MGHSIVTPLTTERYLQTLNINMGSNVHKTQSIDAPIMALAF